MAKVVAPSRVLNLRVGCVLSSLRGSLNNCESAPINCHPKIGSWISLTSWCTAGLTATILVNILTSVTLPTNAIALVGKSLSSRVIFFLPSTNSSFSSVIKSLQLFKLGNVLTVVFFISLNIPRSGSIS